MMRRTLVILLLLVTTGACTTYTYYGRIAGSNSAGRDVQALAYWHVTERKLWFDSASGAIRVKTGCSTRTLVFNERPGGIVFLWEPGVIDPGGTNGPGTICGRIVGARHIADLGEGPLRVEILCEADVDEFTADAQRAAFIAPRPGQPYVFEIRKEELDTDPNVSCDL